ncbi:MAG: hypothetical protein FJX77_01045 [Armatimonadetes bacterium]|nr:hypothetical protein [Armatimonadota bacterium]
MLVLRSPTARPAAGFLAMLCVAAGLSAPPPQAQQEEAPRLLLAFASFRDRPLHPRTYFYEHDGAGQGRAAGGIEPVNLRVDTHPTLGSGGRICAVASEVENQPSDLLLWDLAARQIIPSPPGLNSDTVEIGAALSGNGEWLASATWRREGYPGGWNLLLYHLKERKVVPAPINTDEDESQPTLSADGRWIAFSSNRPGGAGLSDLYLYDRGRGQYRPLPGLNTAYRETDPALSADGNWLAFTSNRPGGVGALDIYLYNLRLDRLTPLPGVNGTGPDQTPALSQDGRFLVSVAERAGGTGERDIYLYDRALSRTIPTPGLNTASEEFDPAVWDRRAGDGKEPLP